MTFFVIVALMSIFIYFLYFNKKKEDAQEIEFQRVREAIQDSFIDGIDRLDRFKEFK